MSLKDNAYARMKGIHVLPKPGEVVSGTVPTKPPAENTSSSEPDEEGDETRRKLRWWDR